MRYPRRLAWASVRSLPHRLLTIARGKRAVNWLGVRIEFESRFEPILLHAQQTLVCRLDRLGVLPQGGSVLDIGANVGQFGTALHAARSDLRVASLEPNPQCQGHLAANASQYGGWSVLPVGIGSSNGQMTLWFVDGRSAQGSAFRANASLAMLGTADDHVRSAEVDVISGEALAARLPERFDLVKIDVEGFEATVLPEIAKCRWDYLVVELGGDRDGALSAPAAAALLGKNGALVEPIAAFGRSDEVHDVLFHRVAG